MNWRYLVLRILRKVGILAYLNLNLTISGNRYKFRIPVFRGIGLDHFCQTENWMTELIFKLTGIKRGKFIDVGVNIGQTLLKLKSLNQEIHYVGFEPNPQCIYYLNELIKLNGFRNVSIVPAGVYSFNGVAEFFLDKDNPIDSCGTLVRQFRNTSDMTRALVPVISGNSLGFLDGEIAILKIDVEGSEVEVIEQFKDVIEVNRPFVICEILPAYSKDNAFRIERHRRIESIFSKLNYKIVQIGHQSVPVERIPINADVMDSNYLFFPIEFEKNLK